jgi:O-glycosyl hydrolase
MKWNFSQSVSWRRMKLPPLLAGLMLSPLAGLATDSIYINTGTINNNNLPQVDATNFYNSGTWNIDTADYPYYLPTPYQTAHTLNYTNVGTMVNSVGWEFDYGPLPLGGRGWSASFANNSSSATIEADDGDIYNPPNNPFPTLASYLFISATNIVNKGELQAGANGELVINGGTVSLARGQLTIASPPTDNGFIRGTNFALDTGLYGETWAQTNVPAALPTGNGGGIINLLLMDSSALWDGTTITLPSFGVQDNCSTNFWSPDEDQEFPWPSSSLAFAPTLSEMVDINQGASNEVRQAVFVRCGSGVTPQINFTPSTNPTNYVKTLAVKLSAPVTNALTLSVQTNTIYWIDTLGSETNRWYYIDTNVSSFYQCSGPVYQPANYIVSELDPVLPQSPTGQLGFGSGSPGFGTPPANFFYNTTYANAAVSNTYSAYSVRVDDLAANPFGAVATNLPGRIQINANNLDLSRAKLGAQGDIWIQASNLVGSAGAVVDCQNLSFNFGSTNGNLIFTNLAKADVSRLQGTIYGWSALWTNSYVAQAGTTNATTNTIVFSLLVLDASGLSSQVPVAVHDLALYSTNITIADDTTVDQSLLLDGQSFTLLGSLILSGDLQDWNSAIAPTLQYFTNDGYLYIPNEAHFGDDTPAPYTEFVNTDGGIIVSGGQTINSLDLQINNAVNYTFSGDFSATAQSIEITGIPSFFPYSIYSSANIQLFADTLQLNQSALYASLALDFTVTNSLSDNGSANSLTCNNGFNLWVAPQTGDLLSSTITSVAPGDEIVDHAWAGVDQGTNWSLCTSNNVPIGTLKLQAQNPSQEPLFHFYGTTGSNAMYVLTLDLSQLTTNAANLTSMIKIDPGMKIYFSQVVLGFNPPGSQTPQAYLQSQFPAGQFVQMPNILTNQISSMDWNTTYQEIDGFGASSAWQYLWTSTEAALFFSTNTGIVYTDSTGRTTTNNGVGLSLLRTDIPPAGSTSAGDTPPAPNEFQYLMNTVAQNYPYVRIWSTPWTPAVGFKSTNDIYDSDVATFGGTNGGSFWGGNATNQAYASQLANYVATMSNIYHISTYAISVQNEPDADVTSYQACQWTAQQIHDFVPYLYNALTNAGMGSTKILLPESQNWPDYHNLAGPTLADPNTLADVSIIADHNYDGPNFQTGATTTPAPKSVDGKALWETEVSTGDSFNGSIANGMYWAKRIYLFLTVAQVNAWHYWWLVPSGSDNQGLTDNSSQTNPVLAKRLFVLGQFSRFVRPGYVRIAASTSGSNLLVSAYKDPNSQNFAIVVINPNANIDVTGTFSLTNFAAGSVTPWMTSSSNSLAQMPAVPVSNSSFTCLIPAQSVVTFVGNATSTSSTAPTLIPVANRTINAGQTLLVTNAAIDPNVPPQTLTFSLLTAPTNASLTSLNATNSLLTWRAPVGLAGTTNAVTVKVTDNGTLLSATNSFSIIVNPLSSLPAVNSINTAGGQVTLMVNGPQGPDYTVLTSTNLATPLTNWQVLLTTNSPVTPVTLVVTNFNNAARFYRIQIGP